MNLRTKLNFDNGNCQEALDFYQTALNGNVTTVLRVGDMSQEPHDAGLSEEDFEEYKNHIIYAKLEFGENVIYASDNVPGFETVRGSNACLALDFASPEELEEIYAKLSKECVEVSIPLGATEWAETYGMIIDKYGVPWVFNYYGSNKP